MKTKSIKRLFLTAALVLSMVLSPAVMQNYAFAAEGTGTSMVSSADTNLDGKNVLTLMINGEKKDVLQDPMFYRYYDIGLFGVIKAKKVSDDMEKYNTPAPGQGDIEAEVISDMNAVGCGVTGMGKAQVPTKYKSYKKYNCLDISEWQGKISDSNWKTIKNAGVTHVIIRVGGSRLKNGTSFSDTYYQSNINGAYKAGIKIGVYYFSQALTTSEAQNEAAYTLKLIEPYKSKITLPVVFDYESNQSGRLTGAKLKSLGKSGTVTKICQAYCDKVKAGGFTPMVYANYTTLVNYTDYKTLQSKYKMWLANYTTNGAATTYPGEYYMWQYSSSGKVSGLSGYVDMNYLFVKGSGSGEVSSETPVPSNPGTTTPTTKPTTSPTKAPSTGSSNKYNVKACTEYKVKTTRTVNYRKGPGTKYEQKGTFVKGRILTVTGRVKINGYYWAQLRNGYFIKLYGNTEKYGYQAVTNDSVNYRTGPGTQYKVLGEFKKGKVLTIIKTEGKWSKTMGGSYVYSTFLDKL